MLSSSFSNEINIDQADYDLGPGEEGEKQEVKAEGNKPSVKVE